MRNTYFHEKKFLEIRTQRILNVISMFNSIYFYNGYSYHDGRRKVHYFVEVKSSFHPQLYGRVSKCNGYSIYEIFSGTKNIFLLYIEYTNISKYKKLKNNYYGNFKWKTLKSGLGFLFFFCETITDEARVSKQRPSKEVIRVDECTISFVHYIHLRNYSGANRVRSSLKAEFITWTSAVYHLIQSN